MPHKIKDVPSWIWATIVGLGTSVGVITGIMSIWNQIEHNTQSAVQTAAVLITTEIRVQTDEIAEFFEDDLYERIIILETEIENLIDQNEVVPTQKKIQLKSMIERLDEFKGRGQ